MKKIYIFAIVIVIIIIFIMFRMFLNEENYIESGNFANMGLVATDDKNIFYNKYPDGIFKINDDGSEFLITDDLAYSINLKDEWIYYLCLGEDSFKLDVMKIKKDGTNKQLLNTINSTYTRIFVNGDWLYYSNHDSGKSVISKMDFNGENVSVVIDKAIQNFQVTNKYIYYTDVNNAIIRTNLNLY